MDNTKTAMLAMVLVIALIAGGLGCLRSPEEYTRSNISKPFYTDRVVTVRIAMAKSDWEFIQKNARAEQYVRADMWYDGRRISDIAIRTKGNSSLFSTANSGSVRFSFKVDLNFFNSSRHLDGIKKLNFNNGFSDPTLIREVLAYELFKQMNIPTPRTAFVDFWVNDTHLGLYTMVEQIDKTFLNNYFADDTGNLYKPVMPAAYLKWTKKDVDNLKPVSASDKPNEKGVNLGGGNLAEIMQALDSQSPGSKVKPTAGAPPPGGMMPPGMPWGQRGNLLEQMGLKTNENKPDHSLLFRFLDILNNEPDETFPDSIERVLDVDKALRFIAVSTVIVHLDNYLGQSGHNYYLYEIDGKFTVIPWDLNMAFGTFNSGIDRQGIINFLIDEPTAGPIADRPLVARLLSVPSYLEAYHRYLIELINGPFSEAVMNSRIDELANMIRPHVEKDVLKFYSTDDFETNLSKDIKANIGPRWGMTPIGLKTFVAERNASIRKQLEGTLPSKSTDSTANKGNTRFGPARLQFDQGGNQ